MFKRLSLIPLAAFIAALAPGAAHAATTCSYDQIFDKVQITMTANHDSAVLGRSGSAITLNGTPCGLATVNNTSKIAWDDNSTGNTFAGLELNNGQLGPGSNPPFGDSSPQIPITINGGYGYDSFYIYGDAPTDKFRIGSSASAADSFVNLDVGAEGFSHDSDVELKGVENVQISGGNGNDVIDASAHDETGTYPFGGDLGVEAMDGNDTLTGGSGYTDLRGGEGNDKFYGGKGDTTVRPGPGDDVAVGGAGKNTVDYFLAPAGVHVDLSRTDPQNTGGDGVDQISGFNNVVGSKFDDQFAGNALANVFEGSGGTDTVSYAHPSPGVQKGVAVSLAKPNQQQDTGSEGQDTLTGISNLIGSPFGDTLTGTTGANRIDGGGGSDTIDAGDGADTVLLRDGISDHADCGGATDTVQSDWAGLDVLVGCENVDFAPSTPAGGDVPAGTGTGTVTGSGTGAAADTTLTFRFSAKKYQHLGKRGTIKVRLSCPDEACSGEVSAKLAARSAAHRTIAVGAGAPKVVAMKLNARTVRKARAALRAGRKVTVRVTAVARDAAGNRKTVTRKVVLGA